jgi:hypothetical protein
VISSNPISPLHSFLNNLPSGETKLSDENKRAVLKLLENCWESLKGSSDQNTYTTKIHRAESICWNPPILSFKLERHGRTVNGSSRADLHQWEVDVEQGTASIKTGGYRQLTPTSPKMDTKLLAEEVVNNILNTLDHHALEWNSDRNYVVIKISELIPEGVPQTTRDRRKRFNKQLEAIMVEHGWVRRNKGNRTGFFREK